MKSLLLALTFGLAATSLIAADKKTADEGAPPPGKYSEKSIYQVTSTWTTDTGKEFQLDSLRGKPVVLGLFFTHCDHSCPVLVRDIKSLQTPLTPKAAGNAQFVLVSIDSERDTPATLKEFRKKYLLADERWILARGDEDAVKQLAEKLGFAYAPGSKTQFGHSVLVTILDEKGVIKHQQAGLGVDRSGAIATIEKLAGAKKPE